MHVFTGIVIKGKRRGTALGYPTLNIPLPPGSDVAGIYAGHAWLGHDEYRAAIFADPARGILEVHLLDFSSDAYGKQLDVQILKKIREAKSFDTDEALKQAIAEDIGAVRQYFSL
ncbi:MAG: riboflavin kinase [Candidatus Kaiserbacteria bacterium]|nr:riboflavin kinase [Candidatus Kaiserbacteria bacterium]